MLDIGGDVGALVVRAPPAYAGAEVEAWPEGQGGAWTHTVVHHRRSPAGDLFAGVFPALPAGGYTLVCDHRLGSATVSGGEVSHFEILPAV